MKTIEEILDKAGKLYIDRVKRTGETFDEYEIICPYCVKELSDWFELMPKPKDEEEEIQCNHCDRHFMVSARIAFSTRKMK